MSIFSKLFKLDKSGIIDMKSNISLSETFYVGIFVSFKKASFQNCLQFLPSGF